MPSSLPPPLLSSFSFCGIIGNQSSPYIKKHPSLPLLPIAKWPMKGNDGRTVREGGKKRVSARREGKEERKKGRGAVKPIRNFQVGKGKEKKGRGGREEK